MKTSFIKSILTAEGFNSTSGQEYIRELPNVRQRIVFVKSSLGSSFYISAFVSIDRDEGKLEIGGSICGGAIDYLQSSFTDSSADNIRNIYNTVLNPWFNALYSEYASDEGEEANAYKKQNPKYGLIKSSEQLLSILPQTIGNLEEMGFEISRLGTDGEIRFSRKINDIFHVLELAAVSQGVFLAARVHVWMPEFQVFEEFTTRSTPAHFETLTNVNGGFIHNNGEIDSKPVIPLEISLIEVRQNIDSVLVDCMKTVDVNYFSTIQNRVDLLDSVDPYYKRSSYFKHLYDDNLPG